MDNDTNSLVNVLFKFINFKYNSQCQAEQVFKFHFQTFDAICQMEAQLKIAPLIERGH